VTTAQLFAEALDALHALLLSGAVWLVLLCGALGLAVYAVCVAVWVLPSVAWQAVTAGLAAAAAARALSGPVAAVQGPEAPEALPRPGKRHAPAWAPDTPPEIEEAA
jgi:hypothetical protein